MCHIPIRQRLCAWLSVFLVGILPAWGQSAGHHWLNNNAGLSNSAINTIFQDSEGFLWFGTWDGLNRYDGAGFTQYRCDRDEWGLSHQIIRSIDEEGTDYLWITTDYGINRLNKRTERFDHFYLDYQKTYIYQEHSFYCSVSARGQVAASYHGGGLYLYRKAEQTFSPVRVEGYGRPLQVVDLFFDVRNNLWVQDAGGRLLQIEVDPSGRATLMHELHLEGDLHYDQNQYIWLEQPDGLANINVYDARPSVRRHAWRVEGTLNTAYDFHGRILLGTTNGCFELADGQTRRCFDSEVSVLSLCAGSQDILWIGTDGKGVYQDFQQTNFITLVDSRRYEPTNNFPVRTILKDGRNNIWVGSKGGGLTCISYLGVPGMERCVNFDVGAGRTYNSVFALAAGPDCVWVGTDGMRLQYVDLETMRLKSLDLTGVQGGRNIGSVYSIVQTDSATLYVGTSGEGLFRLTIDADKRVTDIRQYKHADAGDEGISGNVVYDICDDTDCLWIATRGGGLNRLDKRTGAFRVWKREPGHVHALCCNDIIALHRDSRSLLWIGTTDGLCVFNPAAESEVEAFRTLDESAGLPNTNIHAILEDNDHHIWVSTSNGLAKVNPETSQVTAYYYEEGLQDNEFSDGAGYADAEGNELYFGGINGFNIVHPALIASKTFMPELRLKQARIDNALYEVNNRRIQTGYQTGTIGLDFAVLDYMDNKKCQLAYRIDKQTWWLKGKEQTWVHIGNSRSVLLSELSPGTYTLYVKQTNAEQTWSEPTAFTLVITPPWWNRWWAWLLYLLGVLAGFGMFYQVKKSRLVMRHELEMEKQEKVKKEEIHQAKLRFFTNIAHEFSNSITLIYGAIEQVFMNENPDERIRRQLLVIRRNTERMHEQIQELMEFRRAETGYLAVRLSRVDISELLQCTLDNFIDVADSKRIRLTCELQPGLTHWVTDRSMTEKIVFNLLSNAIKYTPAEGYIELKAQTTEAGALLLTCTNSGPGIPRENLQNIFNRFTILDNFESKLSEGLYTRNGIGLALCKDLAALMGGTIGVVSEVGVQTTFSVELPDQALPETPVEKPSAPIRPPMPAPTQGQRRPTVLVVDDQEDIRQLIRSILEADYDVVEAADGVEALERTDYGVPSLVVADIVMPRMNGIDFVRELKQRKQTQYVPIIILSSRSAVESRVAVMETGADLFIGKPFHPRYLKAAVDRILQNNDRMKNFAESAQAYQERYGQQLISREDKAFIDRVVEAIGQNFGDENYNQDLLARDMAVSRVQLYRKMKQITQGTPGDFIRNYRLTQAERMLTQTDKTVAEIISECGFHNKAYFYRAFAARHDCSPKDYRARHGEA